MGTLQEQQRKFDESVAYIENLRTSGGEWFNVYTGIWCANDKWLTVWDF